MDHDLGGIASRDACLGKKGFIFAIFASVREEDFLANPAKGGISTPWSKHQHRSLANLHVCSSVDNFRVIHEIMPADGLPEPIGMQLLHELPGHEIRRGFGAPVTPAGMQRRMPDRAPPKQPNGLAATPPREWSYESLLDDLPIPDPLIV